MENNNRNYNFQQIEEEDPIDWKKYIAAFFGSWKKIVVVTVAFAVIGVIVALVQPRKYSVAVTLAPESNGANKSGSSLGGLASMLGVNVGGAASPDAFNITIFPEIVSSTPFLTSLFDVELNRMPKLPNSPTESRKIMSGSLPSVKLYDYLTGRGEERGWLKDFFETISGSADKDEDSDYLVVDRSRLTKEQYYTVQKIGKMISVVVDKKTAMTTVSVTMDDPLMCAQLADTVCSRLRDFVFEYRTQKERQNFEYYEAMCDSTYKTMVEAQAAYAASVDNNRNVILQMVSVRSQRFEQEAAVASQVYQQMVQQREMSRAQLQEVKPVFAVVEPATLPQLPVNSRKQTVLLFLFLGFVLSSAWYVVLKEYFNLYRSELKNILNGEKY